MKNLKKPTQAQLRKEQEQLVRDTFNVDLDKLNLDKELKEVQIKNPTSVNEEKKSSLYKLKLDKQGRKKVRNKRNKLINNILFYATEKQIKELKETIKEFNVFYKETYLLNDFSTNSIASKNSDKDTIQKIELAFKILKASKKK